MYQKKTDIEDLTSAYELGNKYIAEYKDWKEKTQIVINSKYDIESIKPWDTIQVKNIDYSIINLQIVKMSYTGDQITLDLEEYDSIWKEFLWDR